jgi:hypothetical protein
MTPVSAKKWILRIFIILVLVWFLAFTALSAVMYLSSPKEQVNLEQMQIECEDNWLTRDQELEQCLQEQDIVINSKENCEQEWWTWYAENEVCIK